MATRKKKPAKKKAAKRKPVKKPVVKKGKSHGRGKKAARSPARKSKARKARGRAPRKAQAQHPRRKRVSKSILRKSVKTVSGKRRSVRVLAPEVQAASRKARKRREAVGAPRPVRKDRWEAAVNAALGHLAERARFNGFEVLNPDVHVNADGSVDGEIRIQRPDDDTTVREMIINRIERWTKVPPGGWISVGCRYEPTDEMLSRATDPKAERYNLHQGMVTIGTYGQQASQKGSNFLAARKIAEGMKESMGREATEVYVRINMSDRQPERVGDEIAKKRERGKRR